MNFNRSLNVRRPARNASPVRYSDEFDEEYIARLRDRDPAALNHFYDHFRVPLRNFAHHHASEEQADDMIQQIFRLALKRLDEGEVDEPSRLPGCVHGVCRDVACSFTNHASADTAKNIGKHATV